MALIPLNTFKTKTAVLTTLKYNQAKCARDTGLIIDSIAYDLLFGGATQTAFAATQYWSQDEIKIPGEVFQTVSALQHAKEVAKKLVRNEVVYKSIGNKKRQRKQNILHIKERIRERERERERGKREDGERRRRVCGGKDPRCERERGGWGKTGRRVLCGMLQGEG